MPNFGKIFPATQVGRVYAFSIPYQPFPPMWMRLKTDGGSTGSVAAQWRNLDLISQEKVRVSNSSIVDRYRFLHPTNTDLRIDMLTEYETKPPGPFFPSTMGWHTTVEAYDASGLIASDGPYWYGPDQVFSIGLDNTWANFFSNRPFPAKWFSFSGEQSVAEWSDVPAFHPYRH